MITPIYKNATIVDIFISLYQIDGQWVIRDFDLFPTAPLNYIVVGLFELGLPLALD